MKKQSYVLLIISFLISISGLTQINNCGKDLPDLIPYRKGNKWGYCDKNKKIIIPTKFDDASLFEDSSQKQGVVRIKDKWFLIDKFGKTKPTPKSMPDKLLHISSDVYVYQDEKSKKFGVRRHGNTVVIQAIYDEISISDNEILFLVTKNGKSGYVDCKGTEYFED